MVKRSDAVKILAKRVMLASFKTAWLMPFVIMIGCATQGHRDSADDDNARLKARYERFLSTELSAAKGNIQIKVYPLLDDELAKYLLGVTTAETEMHAAYVVVTNNNDYPVKIDLPHAAFDTANGRYPVLSTEAAIDRALKSDAGPVVASWLFLGMVGALIVGNNTTQENMTIEEHYWENSFKPTMINKKSSGKGYVFFKVTEENVDRRNIRYTIPVIDIAKNEVVDISVSVENKDPKTPADERK